MDNPPAAQNRQSSLLNYFPYLFGKCFVRTRKHRIIFKFAECVNVHWRRLPHKFWPFQYSFSITILLWESKGEHRVANLIFIKALLSTRKYISGHS